MWACQGRPSARRCLPDCGGQAGGAVVRQPGEPGPIVFRLGAAVERGDIPELIAHLRACLEEHPGDPVVCDIGGLVRADLAAVEALARLRLVARRYGRPFRLRHASAELIELLALVGLSAIVPAEPASALPTQGETEEREELRRVEEERDASDATG